MIVKPINFASCLEKRNFLFQWSMEYVDMGPRLLQPLASRANLWMNPTHKEDSMA